MLSHIVFFDLTDKSEAAVQKLIDGCTRYLKPHDGVVFFSAGRRVTDLSRPVNDAEFDVALNIVFETRAAHDAYQTTDAHLSFIAENKDNWARVRVFDCED